jgi:hypothetical protein
MLWSCGWEKSLNVELQRYLSLIVEPTVEDFKGIRTQFDMPSSRASLRITLSTE